MTLERPMFPPRAEPCQIIQLASFSQTKKLTPTPSQSTGVAQILTRRELRRQLRHQTEPATETARNYRLRIERRKAWYEARRLTEYWRARLHWHHALEAAQDWGVADSSNFAPADVNQRFVLTQLWRVALVNQMLTPAPDTAVVVWKRAQLRRGEHRFTDVSPGTIERAIAADVQWLKDHPSRTTEAANV